MKKSIIIKKSLRITFVSVALVVGSTLLSGCNDFLDQEVLGNNTENNFYDTRYKLQSALNAVYDVLQSDAYQDTDYRFGEALGDNVLGDEGLSSDQGQLAHFRFNTSNSVILNRWKIEYKGIRRANQVIANAHRVHTTTNDYSAYREIREILGQAKFLRALFYFNLVKTFGGVPIRPEVEDVDGLVIPRSSLEETYAYIEKDLREAAIMLPNRYTSANSGKASAGAAVALLMKVLMYQGVPGTPSEKWEQLAEIGDYFVKGKSFTMARMLDYPARYGDEEWESIRKRLWFKPQELNDESDPYEGPDFECPTLVNAYALDYKDAYGNPISYINQFFLDGEFCQGSIFEIVFKESGDGSTGDTNEGSSIFSNLFSANPPIHADEMITTRLFGSDIRKSFTIGHHQYTPDMENTEILPGAILSLKWYTPIKERPVYGGDNGKNRRLLRYADVVLMYAEGLNEIGRRQESLEQLNSNKQAVNTINNSTALYIGGGYGYIHDQIWKEREMEFAFEFDRFWDIVRQGRAKEVLKVFADTRSNKRGAYFREGINEIFPIPQIEIDRSNGAVKQNPGY